MKSCLMFVVLVATLTFAYCQDTQRPVVDCDAMTSQSGKRYHEIYVPHERDCNRFYQCTDHGLVELKCLQNLVFFPHINGCVDKTPDNCIIWSQWRTLNP